MKNTLRLTVATAVLFLVGTLPLHATVFGGDPPPPQKPAVSYSTAVVNTILTIFGV